MCVKVKAEAADGVDRGAAREEKDSGASDGSRSDPGSDSEDALEGEATQGADGRKRLREEGDRQRGKRKRRSATVVSVDCMFV